MPSISYCSGSRHTTGSVVVASFSVLLASAMSQQERAYSTIAAWNP